MNRLLYIIALSLLLAGSQTRAGEPARAFLDGLRQRGYHDVAMDYLNQMQSSRLAPPELKTTVLYEKALLLIDFSRRQRDATVRSNQVNQAQGWLQQFIQEQPTNPKANAARSQLGSLIVERARMIIAESKKGDTAQLTKEALALYEQSFEVFSTLQAQVAEKLDAIPKVLNTRDRKEALLVVQRKQLRADFLNTELFAAAIREEVADVLPAGSAEQTKYLTEAADMYDGIYKNYRTRLAGRYARMYQGRCYRRLGKTRQALGYFGELLDLSSATDDLLRLKAKALRMAMEAWLSPGEQKYFEAIKQATRWFDETPADKQRDPDWIAIRFHLARAYKMQADDAELAEQVDALFVKQSLEAAKKELRLVASESGEHQEHAQRLLTQLGGALVVKETVQIATFTSAQMAGKEALDAMGPALKNVRTVESQLDDQQDNGENSELSARLEQAKHRLVALQNEAIRNYRLAIELADDQTPQSNVNLVRYFLCYVYFVKQDYFEAALVGDFVARRYPDSPGARQCAKIAMACYLKLSDQNQAGDRRFEIEHLAAVGRYMADTWPSEQQTQQSIETLIPHLINAGRPTLAAEFVGRLPESAASRGEYELVTGQAIWGAFREQENRLRTWQQQGVPEEIELSGEQQKLEQFSALAQQLLQAGYDRLPAEPTVDESAATAMLSLAQVHVQQQRYDAAIEVLEHTVLGPLTLVGQESIAAANPLFIEETYRTALQAYVASLGSGEADAGLMDKAKGVIVEMRTSLGDNNAGKQRMLGVYVGLAQDVQRRMKSASPAAQQQMSSVFESFLLELSAGSDDLNVLNWVADTFTQLAGSFAGGDDQNESAQKYYQLAATTFENVLGHVDLNAKMKTQTKVRLANVKFQTREFDAALKLYQNVLAENPSTINVQVSTATLLQTWGPQDSSRYQQAIAGLKPHVWGWGKIALATAEHKEFREVFFQARYEMVNCQFALALTGQESERKTLLAKAEQDLSRTATLYPALNQWQPKYDALMKQIQTAAGKKPLGLPSTNAGNQ